MEQPLKKNNLIIQLAKQKAETQKSSVNSSRFSKTKSGKPRFNDNGLLGPSRGGRNGQGKP